MSRQRSAARRLVLMIATLAAIGLLAAGFSGCERAPAQPEYNNPFDPLGSFGGDPLQLTALAAGGSITLIWSQPQGMGIFEYVISRADHPDSTYRSLASVEHTEADDNLYKYETPAPTQDHWFRVQALDASGRASLSSYATPTSVALGPRVIFASGSGTTASRYVDLRVVVSRGTLLKIARGPTYDVETQYAAANAGDTASILFDVGAAAQGDTIGIRVKATDGAFTSTSTRVVAKVDFAPDFKLASGATSVGARAIGLKIPDRGVTRMRFAASAAALTTADWFSVTAGDSGHVRSDYMLSANAAPQQVWGEFDGDFGFSSVRSITLTPDLLTAAAFRLAVPENHVVEASTVAAVLTGKATLVRWSEVPDLAAVAWQAFSDTLQIPLSLSSGLKTIYLQMRNDWADSPILTDYAILVARPVEVAFIAPIDGASVTSGVTLQVRGRAAGDAGSPAVDLVEFDAGDGLGFRPASGTTSWSYLWNVPTVAVDSLVVLRARAWKGTEFALASINVTVKP